MQFRLEGSDPEIMGQRAENVHFIVSAEACSVPVLHRAETWGCRRARGRQFSESDLTEHNRAMEKEQEMLLQEWQTHDDLVIVEGVDIYSNLLQKLRGAFRWASQNTDADWMTVSWT